MYKSLFAWLKTQHPDLKTIYGGVEKDFAHSNSTFGVMKEQAGVNGFQVLEFSSKKGTSWQSAISPIVVNGFPSSSSCYQLCMRRSIIGAQWARPSCG